MSRKPILISVAAAVVIAAAAASYFLFFRDTGAGGAPPEEAASAPVASGPVPVASMLVLDKAVVLQRSMAGQDIGRQVQALAQQARAELDPQGKALQNESQALKAQLASLPADQRDQRIAAFEAKQAAFQQKAAAREAQIKGALANAQRQMEQKLGPILKQIMTERKANLIVDKQAVAFAVDPSFDISQDAVKRLDAALPSVKVELPPAQAPGQGQ